MKVDLIRDVIDARGVNTTSRTTKAAVARSTGDLSFQMAAVDVKESQVGLALVQ